MLHRLMGWSILSKPNRIMGKHIDDMKVGKRCQSNCRPQVVGEGKEGGTIRNYTTMERHSVEDASHGMLSNTKY